MSPASILDHLPRRSRIAPLVATTAFCAAGVGYAACVLGGALPSVPIAWLAFAAASLLAGGVATALIDRLVLAPLRALSVQVDALRAEADASAALRADLATRAEQQRRLRHDLRGAMSPVLLIADRLIAHPDPAVKRSGDIMDRTVERATQLLAEPSLPAGP